MRIACMIKGVKHSEIEAVCRNMCLILEIENFIEKPIKYCSYGITKRIWLGIALLGHPRLACLDDPTSHLDLSAQRLVWNIIQSIRNKRRTVFLTSSDLYECETVSSRIAIISSGMLINIGTPADVCRRYSTGYKLWLMVKHIIASNTNDMLLKANRNRSLNLLTFVETRFPNAVLR